MLVNSYLYCILYHYRGFFNYSHMFSDFCLLHQAKICCLLYGIADVYPCFGAGINKMGAMAWKWLAKLMFDVH